MSNENQHIPSGYKPSPLGIIPEDWEVKRLGDVCTFHNGRAYSQKELLSSGKYRVLRVGNFFTNSSWYWSDMELENDKYANNGDLLYAWSASFGPRFWEGEKVIYHYHIWKIDSFKNISKEFLYSFLLFDAAMLTNTLQGGTMVHVTKENMEKRNIAIPSIIEQNKIVDLLSLWDTAIAKQTALIEQLTLRKRGLMQQLLTGKKRLKGFEGEWKEVRLGEIGTAYGGLVNKNKEDFENGNALFITYMNVFSNGKIDIDNLGQVRILTSEKQEQVQYGDIFFTVSSETPDEVGMASVLLNEVQNTYLNSFCFGYRLNDFKTLVPEYASYLLRGDNFRRKMYTIAQGSTRFNISKTEVLSMRITIPSIEEQTAIASVLVDADKEIEIQKQKLAAMQAQKKGLMQVLLTGKKRVKL